MAYDVKSVNTTLCYLRRGEDYLMLHRVKKQNDVNQDKWIGVGGKFEADESPEDCLLREVREETGLELTRYQYRGIVTFVSARWVTEYMHRRRLDRGDRGVQRGRAGVGPPRPPAGAAPLGGGRHLFESAGAGCALLLPEAVL